MYFNFLIYFSLHFLRNQFQFLKKCIPGCKNMLHFFHIFMLPCWPLVRCIKCYNTTVVLNFHVVCKAHTYVGSTVKKSRCFHAQNWQGFYVMCYNSLSLITIVYQISEYSLGGKLKVCLPLAVSVTETKKNFFVKTEPSYHPLWCSTLA